MRTFPRLAITLALFAASSTALAVTAQSGFFLSTAAGYGSPEVAKSGELGDGTVSTSSSIGSFALGLSAGVNYALTQHWLAGLEFAYDPYDGKAVYDFSPGGITMSSRDFDATLNATYLFNNGFNFFAKGGVARLTQTYTVTDLSGTINNFSRTRPIARAGVGYLYALGKAGSLNVFAEYTHIFAKNGRSDDVAIDTSPISVDILQGGLTYTFPM